MKEPNKHFYVASDKDEQRRYKIPTKLVVAQLRIIAGTLDSDYCRRVLMSAANRLEAIDR